MDEDGGRQERETGAWPALQLEANIEIRGEHLLEGMRPEAWSGAHRNTPTSNISIKRVMLHTSLY